MITETPGYLSSSFVSLHFISTYKCFQALSIEKIIKFLTNLGAFLVREAGGGKQSLEPTK